MCGRYPQSKRAREAVRAYFVTASLAPRAETWNLAPTTLSLVVKNRATGLAADWLTWGLNLPATGMNPINARVETAATKALFRESWQTRRCVVPADGWYEWKSEKGRKQPYFFYRRDCESIFFAGVWQAESFAILTTAADGALAQIHNRRPLALPITEGRKWIELGAETPSDLVAHLVPAVDIAFHTVSTRVSRPQNDGTDLLVRLPPSLTLDAQDLFDSLKPAAGD